LLFGSRETGLEGSADKTKYKVMFRNAGQSLNIKYDNSSGSFERVEEFKYLETNLTN